MSNIIEVEGLTKTFLPSARVVDGVSFKVGEGEIFSLLGPNGAGKTTTIRMLTTLASISEGRATVAGHDVAKNPGAVRALIGVVPQEVTIDNELKVLVERLCRFGLARKAADDEGVYYGVTPRGLEFLDTFWKMKGFLEEFGEAEPH